MLFTTLKLVAVTPPKLTADAPVNPEPVMVTVEPVKAVDGVKDVMVGGQTVTELEMNPSINIGEVPTLTVFITVLVAVLIILSVASTELFTYNLLPSKLRLKLVGLLPTGMVVKTLLVAVLITEITLLVFVK